MKEFYGIRKNRKYKFNCQVPANAVKAYRGAVVGLRTYQHPLVYCVTCLVSNSRPT